MALLGWNPGTEQEIFTLDELVEAFDINKVGNRVLNLIPIRQNGLTSSIYGKSQTKKSQMILEPIWLIEEYRLHWICLQWLLK